MEVSSAQLERISDFKPHIAVILNIADDHMDRYKNFYEYFNEKLKIFSRQNENDILILNFDAHNLRRLKGLARSKVVFFGKEARSVSGYHISAFTKDQKIYCEYEAVVKEIMSVGDIKMKGAHNLENVLVSCLIGYIAGVGARSIADIVSNFTGLEHRFETVDTV
jgi:UDP-N-acetylmuramoylalanine--D-glutamate ligase